MNQSAVSWIGLQWDGQSVNIWLHDQKNEVISQRQAAHAGIKAILDQLSPDLPDGKVTPVISAGLPDVPTSNLRQVPARPVVGVLTLNPDDPRIKLLAIPGLQQRKPVAQMSGDETMVAGYLQHNPDFDGVICSAGPQTHWIHISAGEVVSFQTFLTSLMTSFMAEQLSIAPSRSRTGVDNDALVAAMNDIIMRPQNLGAELAQLAANKSLNDASDQFSWSKMLGLMIGLELSGARPYWLGQRVAILGDEPLATIYSEALHTQGVPSECHDRVRMAQFGLASAYAKYCNVT